MTPGLGQLIYEIVKYTLGEVNTAIPARVLEYDPEERRASVQPTVKRRYKDGSVVSRAPITDVPVVFPSAGGGTITFPVKPGDTVLLIFSQRSIDRWVQSEGGEVDPLDNRKHDISDAIAIPGLAPFPAALPADPDNVTIEFGSVSINLTPGGAVEITAPGGVTINGDVTVDGDVVADGISLKEHVHSGVSSGGSTSGPPVP